MCAIPPFFFFFFFLMRLFLRFIFLFSIVLLLTNAFKKGRSMKFGELKGKGREVSAGVRLSRYSLYIETIC